MIAITEFSRERAEPTGFLEDIWPRLEAQAQLVVNTYVLRYPSGNAYVHDKIIETCSDVVRQRHTDGLLELGPLCALRKDALETVKYGSFYNGHMNVLFAVKLDDVRSLSVLSCFDEETGLDWSSFEALSNGDRRFLESVIERMSASSSVLTFAHDGEPLFLLGRQAK